ncbi:MAG: hypothetical protein K2H64_06120, partial [Desulfovibrio sp.]|nr:hypothetical protein [Desulfovibrio sp.]
MPKGKEADYSNPDFAMEKVCENGENLRLVPPEFQLPAICLAAICQNPKALKHVDDQTPRLCMEAIIEDPE